MGQGHGHLNLNKLKGTLELLGDGLKNFNLLSEKKSFWVAYIICFGFLGNNAMLILMHSIVKLTRVARES